MKSLKSWLIVVPLLALLASCSAEKPVFNHTPKRTKCFNSERHDKYDFKSKAKLPFMENYYCVEMIDHVLSTVKLNEGKYVSLLKKKPLVTRNDIFNYFTRGVIPKGYEPEDVKLFEMKKLETDRVRMLLDSKDSEMRNLGMLMVGAHIKEFYPVNHELMEGKRAKLSEKDFINYCKSQLDEIEVLESERVGDDPLDAIRAKIKGIKSGMGNGWG